jgi:hypothetical protein
VKNAWDAYKRGTTAVWDLGSMRLVPQDADSRSQGEGPALPSPGRVNNPYMVVYVDNQIIDGHSNIWGPAFSSFLYNFVAMQFADAGVGRCKSSEIVSHE